MHRGWSIALGGWFLAVRLVAADAPAVEPLATAGTDHATVVAALIALGRGDPDPLTALPAHLLSDAPAIADAQDPDLARRWPLLVPAALQRLPVAQRERLAARLDERYRSAGPGAIAWDYLPAPAAQRAVEQLIARDFDHGRLLSVLLLGQMDASATNPRVAAARTLLGLGAGTLAEPALPLARDGAPPLVAAGGLVRGDGWLFGLDPAGRVRWQRRTERLARVALGVDGALVAEAAGLSAIDLEGQATVLPPLPTFAKPLAINGGEAWFGAGTTVWRLDVGPGVRDQVVLPDMPLGQPLQRGADAWWLTRTELLVTHGGQLTLRMPHLLALSTVATLERHPHGAVIRDGARWWLVTARSEAPPLAQAEALLLAGRRGDAAALLTGLPAAEQADEAARALAVRVMYTHAQTAQELALIALAEHRDPSSLGGNPLLTEPSTDLALPTAAWPHQVTLAAWQQRADGQPPTVTLRADPTTVRLRAQWSAEQGSAGRWWERHWPTRPLLDAPSRTWSLIPGNGLAVADGAGHLLVVDAGTGQRIAEADVPTDVDPAAVVRCGDHAAALLADLGKTLVIVDGAHVRTVKLDPPGTSLRGTADAVVVTSAAGSQTIALPTPGSTGVPPAVRDQGDHR